MRTVVTGFVLSMSLLAGVCECRAGSRVVAWGTNTYGKLDVPAEALDQVSAISAGENHALAIREGCVIAWGLNGHGQRNVPSTASNGIVQVAAGRYHSMALDTNGQVIVWGLHEPTPGAALTGVTAIASGANHCLALKNGEVLAWGYDNSGETIVPDEAKSGVTAIAAGNFFSLALKNGKVIAWGINDVHQCDVPPEASNGVTAIASGTYNSLALRNGRVISWGWGYPGVNKVPPEASNDVSAVEGGLYHALAIRDGFIVGWGMNDHGELSTPPEAASDVTAVSGGEAFSLALVGLPYTGICVNCGGKAAGNWKRDQGCATGTKMKTTAAIAKAKQTPQAVYATCRTGRTLTYSFPDAPDGRYLVRFHFAELSYSQAGKRLFKVKAEGLQLGGPIDVFRDAGGRNKALRRAFIVPVTDGNGLQIRGIGMHGGNAIFNGIEIIRLSP